MIYFDTFIDFFLLTMTTMHTLIHGYGVNAWLIMWLDMNCFHENVEIESLVHLSMSLCTKDPMKLIFISNSGDGINIENKNRKKIGLDVFPNKI